MTALAGSKTVYTKCPCPSCKGNILQTKTAKCLTKNILLTEKSTYDNMTVLYGLKVSFSYFHARYSCCLDKKYDYLKHVLLDRKNIYLGPMYMSSVKILFKFSLRNCSSIFLVDLTCFRIFKINFDRQKLIKDYLWIYSHWISAW